MKWLAVDGEPVYERVQFPSLLVVARQILSRCVTGHVKSVVSRFLCYGNLNNCLLLEVLLIAYSRLCSYMYHIFQLFS